MTAPPERFLDAFPAWAVAAMSLCLGVATAAAASYARAHVAPGSGILGAASQAAQALSNGQSSLMREAFLGEMKRGRDSGLHAFPKQGVGLMLTYAEPGAARAASLSRFDPKAARPCMLELSIDGLGSPSMKEAAFQQFSGRVEFADARLDPPRALAAAFTVAHELAHCSLHAAPWASAGDAMATALADRGETPSAADRQAIARHLATPFGHATLHEGYADAMAAIFLARRMDDAGFESAMGMLAARRVSASKAASLATGEPTPYQTQFALRSILALGRPALARLAGPEARAAALRAAAEGSVAYLGSRPGSPASAQFPSATAAAIQRAAGASCEVPAKLGALRLDCRDL